MSKLRFNGYYYYIDQIDRLDETINYVLRFYEISKTVIQVSIGKSKIGLNENKKEFNINDFFPSGNWFNENYSNSGRYEINGDQIHFDCGKVSYKGTISDNSLSLYSISHINGHESTHLFKFIPFEEIHK